MDVYHVTKLLLMASLLALVACSPLPYGLKPYPQTNSWADSDNTPIDFDSLKLLLRLAQDDNAILRQQQPSLGQVKAKRFDFGMSGLDNIDHILTTLDQTDSAKPHHRTLKQQFYPAGSRSRDIDKLKKLMESVG